MSLDRVYDFLRSPEAAALPNVAFRMVPDVAEVSSAIRMGGGGEGKVTAFGGVPVFQAEGLSVRQGGSKYYPLFLSKVTAQCCVPVGGDWPG